VAGNPGLLIVEDDETVRTQMKWALAGDYEVHMAGDRATALSIVRRDRPSVVLLDLGLPPQPHTTEEGFRTLAEVLREDPLIRVIIVTGNHEREHVVKAIGQGAYDFFRKPVDLDLLKVILKRASYLCELERDARKERPGA
jgi:two-component system NtrC family response regulator